MRKLVALLPLLYISFLGFSNHLVGGDLTYVYNGGNNYTFTLTIYRDCNCPPPCANLDTDINYTIFDGNNRTHNFVKTSPIFGPTQVPISTQGICLATVPNVCVEKGVYTFTENLPPSSQGYTVAYQRCCRNQTIQNIFSPSDEGMTLSVQIPPSGVTNNSATWNNFPPIIICSNNPFEFNHSATDVDGDSLVYSICDPLDGGNATGGFGGNPVPGFASAPPYNTIPFLAPYTSTNPIGGVPNLNIDSLGIIRANPNTLGQFVVGVCCAEYRNGVLINTIRRDFQFNIASCDITLARVEHSQVGPNGELLVYDCDDFDVLFQNTSLGADKYLWDFGDLLSTTDTSSLDNPTYLYPDSGIYCVTLIADPGKVCADTALIKLHLFPGLTPDFDSAVTDCSNIPIQFTDLSVLPAFDMIDSWLWDFGDGDTSNSQNPTHLFPIDGGVFDVTLFLFTDKGCLDSVSKQVLIHPTPRISWTNSLPCPNEVVTFTNTSIIANGTITNYQWNFGDPASGPGNNVSISPNATHIFSSTGTYNVSLTATSNLGCSETVIMPITIYPEVIANAGVDTFVCTGNPIMLRATGGTIYNWMPAVGLNNANIDTPFASPTVATTYFLEVQDPNGCTDFDTIFVDVKPTPVVDAGNDTSICFGSSIQLQAKGGIAYEWDNTPSVNNWFIPDPIATPSGTVTYFISITDSNGCVGRDSVKITVNPPLNLSVSPDITICQFDSTQLSAAGGLYYKWTPARGLSNDTIANPLASPKYTTTYVVEISDDCFTGYDTVTIGVDEAPYVYTNDDITIKAGETAELLGGGGATFEWANDQTLNYTSLRTPIASPLDTTTYYFTAFGPNGCTNLDSVTVFVTFDHQLLLPNAFTPNADGLNDQVKLLHFGIREIDQFQIYNRWGQMVFETVDLESGWDGFFENNKQPIGTYAYIVRAQTYLDEAVEIKGQITLLR